MLEIYVFCCLFFLLSKDNNREGNRNILENRDATNVIETSIPKYLVPSKLEDAKVINPKNKMTEVYIILTPVSWMVLETVFEISHLWRLSSCLYLAKKWIVKSTEIPKATLKTRTVEGLRGILAYPIIPAVRNKGTRLGVSDNTNILTDLKR